jgi:hypothetical protein
MDLRERSVELARITTAATPVVSVYLNVGWTDEQQRERVRVFVKNELARARAARAAASADLAWVEEQAALMTHHGRLVDAHGMALFACEAIGLRETIPVRSAFEDAFVVAPTPYLTPLAALRQVQAPALVAFVDGAAARLFTLEADGRGEELVLTHAVERRHRRGGWALLAQSRYDRHIEHHRGQHFEAVAAALAQLAAEEAIERVVLVGEAGTLATFRRHLAPPVARLVVGAVPGARHESGASFAERAGRLLARLDADAEGAAVDATLDDAAAGGRAVAGAARTADAVVRGAVQRLYLLRAFAEPGAECSACGALAPGTNAVCPRCGAPSKEVDLRETMVDRVIAAGGSVSALDNHAALAAAGGVAARLRYPL